MAEFNDIFSTLDSLLSKTDISDVTAESTGFTELPDGYYLCEVEAAELKESKSSKQPMVALKLNIVEDGTDVVFEDESINFKPIKAKGRKIFLNYVLKDESSIKRFVTNMLKFEGEVEGEPILPKEAFLNSTTLVDALDVITGLRIYAQIATSVNKDGTNSTWTNLISWKRIKDLGLPQ